jgi:hypothetical protein
MDIAGHLDFCYRSRRQEKPTSDCDGFRQLT